MDAAKAITIIPEECHAVEAILRQTKDNMVAVFFADDIPAVIAQLQAGIQCANASIAHNVLIHPNYVAA